ncbi:hypothetical protein CVT26_011668 [Gymnopilus dilepis]|uniref:Uncharacterized protein n=1 Tax=Gymnopilus dilepis TaxID=231916 RepID=A0A409W8X0_9AGAR|nr:hypothetical protein CVT26_011668 [Gymnopilus dilepis]
MSAPSTKATWTTGVSLTLGTLRNVSDLSCAASEIPRLLNSSLHRHINRFYLHFDSAPNRVHLGRPAYLSPPEARTASSHLLSTSSTLFSGLYNALPRHSPSTSMRTSASIQFAKLKDDDLGS